MRIGGGPGGGHYRGSVEAKPRLCLLATAARWRRFMSGWCDCTGGGLDFSAAALSIWMNTPVGGE